MAIPTFHGKNPSKGWEPKPERNEHHDPCKRRKVKHCKPKHHCRPKRKRHCG